MELYFFVLLFALLVMQYYSVLTRFRIFKISRKVFDKKLKIAQVKLIDSTFPLFPIIDGNKFVTLLDLEDNELFSFIVETNDEEQEIVKKIVKSRDEKNKLIKESKEFCSLLDKNIKDDFFVNLELVDLPKSLNKGINKEVIVFIDENLLQETKLCISFEFIKYFVKYYDDVVFKFYSNLHKDRFEKLIEKGYLGKYEKIDTKILDSNQICIDKLSEYLYSIRNKKYNYYNKIFDKNEKLSAHQNLRKTIYNQSFKKNYFLNEEEIYLEVGEDLRQIVKKQFQVILFRDKVFELETFLTKEKDSFILETYIPEDDMKIKKITFNFKEKSFSVE